MRIIAGQWRGRTLKAPPNGDTRPTSARAREALFSMLSSLLGTFEGLTVLDVFAGTGALGLEALSRGAAEATFIEQDRNAVDALRRNISAVGADARSNLLTLRAPRLGRSRARYDLVFLDAPYGQGMTERTLAALLDGAWLADAALICVETGAGETFAAPAFETLREKRYGKAAVTVLRLVSGNFVP